LYRYSWDKEDLLKYPWSRTYLRQPEILKYLEHVVERHNLRQHMQFNTMMTGAEWNPETNTWTVQTSTGPNLEANYLVTGVGLLSKQNFPVYPGIDKYKGKLYHSGAWPKQYDFKGKRVGVLGNGSTGVQIITDIADYVKQLVCFQRTPQYVVPSGDKVATPEHRAEVNANYDAIWKQAKESAFAFGFEESTTPLMSVSKEERERVFEDAWQKGNGFRFMFGTFSDIVTSEEANEEAAKFIRSKIRGKVNDPEKARKLTPTDFYARRPLCDAGYYEKFNYGHVDIVDLKEAPITEFTEKGIKTADGIEHELDAIVFATGFDAVDGNYTSISIKGKNGETLKQRWADGATSYLGLSVPDFPNLFMILGPNGPFTNLPPSIETQVEFIEELIAHSVGSSADTGSNRVIETTTTAEHDWTEMCDNISKDSLFRKADSWIFGANVPGKKKSVLFYFGGLGQYRQVLDAEVKSGYKGYHFY
jgi:cation diffusion facilitator CzcD-associated flavoprotein CzcO